jgi:hypothetical protein
MIPLRNRFEPLYYRIESVLESSPQYLILVGLFTLAFAMSLAFGFGSGRISVDLHGDESDYFNIAVNLSESFKFSDSPGFDAYRPPFVPVVLSAVFLWVSEPGNVLARAVIALFGALAAPLLYLLARQLIPHSRSLPLAGALAWSLYPSAIFYSIILQSESAGAVLVLASTLSLVLGLKTRLTRWFVITGLLWGLLTLARTNYLMMPILILLLTVAANRWLNSDRKSLLPSTRHVTISVAVFVLIIGGWTVRNYIATDGFIPTTSHGGWVFAISNANLDNEAVRAGGFQKTDAIKDEIWAEAEADRNAAGMKLGLEGITSNLGALPIVVINRNLDFWGPRPDPFEPSWTNTDSLMTLLWIPLMTLAAYGIYKTGLRYWFLWLPVLYSSAITSAFWGSNRFRFPVDPLLFMLAMLAIGILITTWLKHSDFNSND